MVWHGRGLRLLFLSAAALLVCEEARADSHSSPCEPGQVDTAQCLEAVKTLVADEDRFWFGSNYSQRCRPPASNSDPTCSNNDPQHLSIVTRLRQSNDSGVDLIRQVLNVTYDVPAGSYESCGNIYNVPAVTHTIDPTETTRIPLWSADHKPRVTWRSEVDKLYTLIVWDAGAVILHGVVYNINGSDSDQGQTARNYRGPKNPVDRDQPYVFLLYEQSGPIEETLILTVAYDNRMKSPKDIVAAVSLTGPIGANVLTVRTDPFATAFMKQNRIVNNCPAMLTPKFAALSLSYNVSEVRLMSSVDVTFTSPEISVTSCCENKDFASNVRTTNPMGDGLIQPVYTQFRPRVSLVPSNFFDTFYFLRPRFTLLLLDVTDELSGTPHEAANTLLHWQVINIREGDVSSGETTQPYKAPLPLAGDQGRERRVFMFLLLRQSSMLGKGTNLTRFTGGGDCSEHTRDRCRFNLTSFNTEFQMSIEGASWFVTSPDAYSRQQAIAQGLQGKQAACRGVSGFQEPCPGPSTCTGGSEVAHASFAIVGLASVVQLLVSYAAFV